MAAYVQTGGPRYTGAMTNYRTGQRIPGMQPQQASAPAQKAPTPGGGFASNATIQGLMEASQPAVETPTTPGGMGPAVEAQTPEGAGTDIAGAAAAGLTSAADGGMGMGMGMSPFMDSEGLRPGLGMRRPPSMNAVLAGLRY